MAMVWRLGFPPTSTGASSEAEAEVRLRDGTVTALGTVMLARPPSEIAERWAEEREYWRVDE
jgi:hypothetical protein